jgi:hypothetical protein
MADKFNQKHEYNQNVKQNYNQKYNHRINQILLQRFPKITTLNQEQERFSKNGEILEKNGILYVEHKMNEPDNSMNMLPLVRYTVKPGTNEYTGYVISKPKSNL